MSNSNTNEAISSISLYARPSESFLFSLLDEQSSQENMSSELINMIQSRMNINNLDTNSNNTNNNHENHENHENTDNEWSVHAPEARTVFQELRMKLKDIESLYKKHDKLEHTPHTTVVPTTETMENIEKMTESVQFFKEKINLYFNKFIECNIQCEREKAFLSHCSSLLDVIQNPYIEEQDFNECANNICKSLENFTTQISNKISQNRKDREIYWNQYKEFRNSCKLVKEVQSDIVCSVCMEREVNMALLNCGHCFCTECSTRCNSCPNCRSSVTKKMKLFF